jgi:putative MATE family efflux protein
MRFSVVAVVANAALDPLLLFGAGPVPALGVGGVALATLMLQALVIVGLWTVIVREGGLAKGLPNGAGVRETLRIGLPSAVLGLGFSGVFVALTPVVAVFGRAPLAALPIGQRVEAIGYYVNAGFAAAAQTLVGQRLGAGRPDLARHVARRAVILAAWVTGPWSLAMVLGAPWFAQVFTTDPEVAAAATAFLAIVGVSMLAQTVEVVLIGAFEGAGDTVPPMIVGLLWHGLRVPLAWMATRPLGLGVDSVWWVFTGCAFASAALLVVLFRRAAWR